MKGQKEIQRSIQTPGVGLNNQTPHRRLAIGQKRLEYLSLLFSV